MKRIAAFLAFLSALSLCSSPAFASVISYNVILSGSQFNVPVSTTASGVAIVTIDDVADTVSVMLSFSGLTGGVATAAHLHCCVVPTGNAPVAIGFVGFPATSSGTYSSPFPFPVGISTILGIEAGLAYLDIHTAVFPGGEIRGNILPAATTVPEPEPFALIGLGMLALIGVRRRRMRGTHRATSPAGAVRRPS